MLLRRVTERTFERKLIDLAPQIRYEIMSFISLYDDQIVEFEFGRTPGKRIYRITLEDEISKEWRVKRKYYWITSDEWMKSSTQYF